MFESEWKSVPENPSCFLDNGHLVLEAMILEATAMTLKDCEGHLVSSYLQVQTFQLIRGVFSGGGWLSSQKLSSCSSGALGPDGAADLDSLA